MTTLHNGLASARCLRSFTWPSDRALRIGLSGGIGAGKTTVAQVFEQTGAIIADADELAREVVAAGSVGLAAIVEAFGRNILTDDGALDRRRLASLVFSDPNARATLEAITHPLIGQRAEAILNTAPVGGIALYDVPLLVEQHMADQFDLVIIVDAPIEQRIRRLARRGIDRAQALQRIHAQASLADRRRVAHIWIHNAGSETELAGLVSAVIRTWIMPG
ncbi:dephospho-CoA kinase [Schaalia suimastitidis]|uniref:dephospho-CoA kinase n=1 Tax=Schaalia suimastitidis TaxID=121163 RepID=UPI0003FD99D4|nr:dephospho-CoA kinase [Schaalia suimastitidis]